jgi:thiamine biosynthesis protein ThiS
LQKIEILVNGEAARISEGQSILQLLDELGVPNDRVAVELNRHIVHKRDWEATAVVPGAQVEIVEFVGGG